MTSSLVGSEMCIRDRRQNGASMGSATWPQQPSVLILLLPGAAAWPQQSSCLLYTSDAADDM
eukprot:4744339-Prorocentrum_lima.AAC.1